MQDKMGINVSLHRFPKKNQMRIAMNKMSHLPTLYRLGPALLFFTFLLGGCADFPTETRYDDSVKTYVSPSAEQAAARTVGRHDKTTAHYILRPGNRPPIQPRPRQAQAGGQPAADSGVGDMPMVLEVSDILFDFDKWVIRRSVVPELDLWAGYLQDNPRVTAEIYGHADSTGPTAYNQQLSYKRAQAVVNYLVGKGVDPKRLTARGFGENQPAAPNTTSEGRQKNRRVELNL
jgi:outer membrane protein OmpA-like peptidoglycan-associated protein